MAIRNYVGARYVPKIGSPVEWQSNTAYEALVIVTYNGSSYTSRFPVPSTVGNPADNPDFWALTGNYNAQVEQYRQETKQLQNIVNNLDSDVKGMQLNNTYINIKSFGCIENQPCSDLINNYVNSHEGCSLYVPNGRFKIDKPINLPNNNIYCDGVFYTDKNYTESYAIRLGTPVPLGTGTYNMLYGKMLKVNLDMSLSTTTGIEIGNFFSSVITLNVVNIGGTGIKATGRCGESRIYMMVYGLFSSADSYGDNTTGVNFTGGYMNDNYCYLIGRNLTTGLALESNLCHFKYIHLWGCATAVYATSNFTADYFYTDFNQIGIQSNYHIDVKTITALVTVRDGIPNYILGNNRINALQHIGSINIKKVDQSTNGFSEHAFLIKPRLKSDQYWDASIRSICVSLTIDYFNYKVNISTDYSYNDYDDYTLHNGIVQLNTFKNLTINIPQTDNENFKTLMLDFGYKKIWDAETFAHKNLFTIPLHTTVLNNSEGTYPSVGIIYGATIQALVCGVTTSNTNYFRLEGDTVSR